MPYMTAKTHISMRIICSLLAVPLMSAETTAMLADFIAKILDNLGSSLAGIFESLWKQAG